MTSVTGIGSELLTPIAAGSLFARSGETIRAAVRNGNVYSPITLVATGKPVNHIDLNSAVKFWGEPHDFVARLSEMRENGTTLGQGRYATMEPRGVDGEEGWPNAGNRLKKDFAQFDRFAAKRYGYNGRNPAALADSYKVPVGRHYTWSEEKWSDEKIRT